MNVTDIPFNRFLGIKQSENPEYILMMKNSENYLNHLGTVHASVQFALAEATSGEVLLRIFKEYSSDVIPVVRRVEVKYSKPANGEIYSKADINKEEIERVKSDINQKGRAFVKVNVGIYDMKNNLTLQSIYEWYIQMIKNKG